jgi:SAM-dependent methyltransferase
MTFSVPAHLLRNHAGVLDTVDPADAGAELIAYMCTRLDLPDLAGKDVLDVGCGTRFTDTLLNRDVAIGTYTGVDIDPQLVAFLRETVSDPRLSYRLFDARNPIYHPQGTPMGPTTELPVEGRRFDVLCLFSVFTHLQPDDAAVMLGMLRRHVRPDGRLFFSARIDDAAGVDYYEADPDQPTLRSRYSSAFLNRLVAEAGWRVLSTAPPWPDGVPVMDSYACAPA